VAAARAQARLDAGAFGIETPTDAGGALDLVLGMRRGQVEALARKLRDGGAADLAPAEQAALLRALDDALVHLATAGKLAADVGVDERRIRLQERQAEALATVINAVMAELIGAGLSARFRTLAAQSFARHLAALDHDLIDAPAVQLAGPRS